MNKKRKTPPRWKHYLGSERKWNDLKTKLNYWTAVEVGNDALNCYINECKKRNIKKSNVQKKLSDQEKNFLVKYGFWDHLKKRWNIEVEVEQSTQFKPMVRLQIKSRYDLQKIKDKELFDDLKLKIV